MKEFFQPAGNCQFYKHESFVNIVCFDELECIDATGFGISKINLQIISVFLIIYIYHGIKFYKTINSE